MRQSLGFGDQLIRLALILERNNTEVSVPFGNHKLLGLQFTDVLHNVPISIPTVVAAKCLNCFGSSDLIEIYKQSIL